MAEKRFYCRIQGAVRGPLSAVELQALAAGGQLTSGDQVRLDGQAQWHPASAVRGLQLAPAQEPPGGGRHQLLATWIFGSILLVFFLGVFVFAPNELPEFKQRMLAFACALLAGLFTFFLTGELRLSLTGGTSWLGAMSTQATGGAAVFVLVLVWWWSPAAPVHVEPFTIDLEAAARQNAAAHRQLAEQNKKMGHDVGGSLKDAADSVARTGDSFRTGNFGDAVLDLSGRKLQRDDLAVLGRYTNLQTLFLSGADFSEDALRHLTLAAGRLRELRLDKTPLTDQGLAHLEDLEHLERLHLGGTAVTDAGLKRLRRLELSELLLDHTPVTGSCFAYLGRVHHFERVVLRGSKLNDEGLRLLAARYVPELDLGDTAITDVGLAHLHGVSGLRRLVLDGTQVTDAAVTALRAACPGCTIRR